MLQPVSHLQSIRSSLISLPSQWYKAGLLYQLSLNLPSSDMVLQALQYAQEILNV